MPDQQDATTDDTSMETVKKAVGSSKGDLSSFFDSMRGSLGVLHESQAEAEAMKPPAMHFAPPPPQYAQTDPMAAFGQPAMWLAVFGAALTKRPMATAIQAAAGVLQSTAQQDQSIVQHNYDVWKLETENGLKQAKYEQDLYKSALSKVSSDARAATAEATVLSHALHDLPAQYILQTKGVQGLVDFTKHRGKQTATTQAAMSDLDTKLQDQMAWNDYQHEHPNMDAKQLAVARQQFELKRKHPDIAAGMQSDDPKEQADALEAYAVQIDKAQQGKGSTAASRMASLTVGVRLRSIAKQLRSDDPVKIAAAQQEAATIPQVGPGVLKPEKPTQGVLSDDAAKLIAERILAGDERATVGMARSSANITKVTNVMSDIAKSRGLSGQEVAVRIAEFQGTLAGERALGTRTANMEVAANVVRQMVPVALDASQKVDRTQYPTLNSVLIAAARGTGDENVVRFAQSANAIIYEYSKFLNPTGIPTDADKARATEILNIAWSQGQFAAALDQIANKEIPAGAGGVAATRREFREGLSTKTTPDTQSTGDPLAAARDAIAKGAPRDAVVKRLRDAGIDPGNL